MYTKFGIIEWWIPIFFQDLIIIFLLQYCLEDLYACTITLISKFIYTHLDTHTFVSKNFRPCMLGETESLIVGYENG